MTIPTELPAIEGAKQLYEWFGYWPDFHDAEAVSLHLNRFGMSYLILNTWETTSEVDERGYFVLSKQVGVEFVLEGVADLALQDFSIQNVIAGLDIKAQDGAFVLALSPCYGLAGTIVAKHLSIKITPGQIPR